MCVNLILHQFFVFINTFARLPNSAALSASLFQHAALVAMNGGRSWSTSQLSITLIVCFKELVLILRSRTALLCNPAAKTERLGRLLRPPRQASRRTVDRNLLGLQYVFELLRS